jgi:hypothetical protein
VATLAGHRDIKMTLRYAHLAPSYLHAGIEALEQRNPRQQTGVALSTAPRVVPVSWEWAGEHINKCWCPRREYQPFNPISRAANRAILWRNQGGSLMKGNHLRPPLRNSLAVYELQIA